MLIEHGAWLEVFAVENHIFHRYLCRQLKSGGMEIIIMRNRNFAGKNKRKLMRGLSLLLAAAMVWCVLPFGGEEVYAAASGDILPTADDMPQIVGGTGETQSAFALGETFYIKGTKQDPAIQQVEVLCHGVQIASKKASPSGSGVSYNIPVDTRNLSLTEGELNGSVLFAVRFVCSNGTAEEIEIGVEITAEAKIEKDGKVEYLGKLADAFEQNSGDGDITLLRDVNDKSAIGAIYYIEEGRDYSLDLNHHNITITENRAIFNFSQNTQLTVKGEGRVELCESTGNIFYLQTNNITLNIEGGEFVGNQIISTNFKMDNQIHISGGTFTSTGTYVFYNARNTDNGICLKDMPIPGYCFVDAQDKILEVGEKTVMYTRDVGAGVTVRKIDFARDAVVESPQAAWTYTYDGSPKKPSVQSVSVAGVELEEGKDYNVDYSDNTDTGEASVTVSGIGGTYGACGSKTLGFIISKAELSAAGAGSASGVYGTKLSELEISGLSAQHKENLSEVVGAWEFDPDAADVGSIPNAGDVGPYTAVFLPSAGADNYEKLTAEVALSIQKAEGILTVPEMEIEKYFGQESFSLNCTANGDGDISYQSDNQDVAEVFADGAVDIKGVGTAVLTVSLGEGANYTGAEAQSVTVTVAKGSAPVVRPETRKYVFTTGSKGPVSIDIADKLPRNRGETKYTVTAKDADGILSDVSVGTDGMLTYTVEGNKAAGSAASITVTAEMEHYEDAAAVADIEISEKIPVELKAGSSVSVNGSSLVYGQALSGLALNSAVFVDQETKETVEGTLAWKEGSVIPNAGTISAEWIFQPDDCERYEKLAGTLPITVAKAVPYIAELPKAAKITCGDALFTSALSGGKVQYSAGDQTVVEGSFAWKDGTVKPAVSDSGNTRYPVVFLPQDKENYCSVEAELTLAVEQPLPAPTVSPALTPTPAPTVSPALTPTPTPVPSGTVTEAQKEKNGLTLNAGLKISQIGNKITVTWGNVKGASGYDIYVQYCGKKFTNKSIHSVKGAKKTKLTVKKVNGKKLDLKKNYRARVRAYKLVNGKKVILGRSISVHVAGRKSRKYTNVKAVKLKKSSYTLKKGNSVAIKASCVQADKKKKQLPDAHAKQFRYASSNRRVAVVTERGKIKAVGKGSCTVYVYARNGFARKIKVKVK